jgi:hypothetical protein
MCSQWSDQIIHHIQWQHHREKEADDDRPKGFFIERMCQVANTGLSGLPTEEKTRPKEICRGRTNYPPCPMESPPSPQTCPKPLWEGLVDLSTMSNGITVRFLIY